MNAESEKSNFALVPKPPSAIEKAEPGAKRVLFGMVADTLALVKKEQARKTRPTRIVIVDDADETRGIYKLLLKNWFKEAILQEFENGDDAWKELSQIDPDLLITRMPTSGRFLLPLLAERMVKYPILVTSAFFSEKEVRERTGPSQNVSFLPLPFTAQQFYQELLIHFGPATATQTAQSFTREFELKWRFGARTAALMVKLANRFASRIQISRGEEVADAKSIMDVMMVSSIDGTDAGCGYRFKVSATGTDAAAAIDALTELFTCGSRVDHCIEPSCPLKPALAGYTHNTISYGCKNGHTWSVRRLNES